MIRIAVAVILSVPLGFLLPANAGERALRVVNIDKINTPADEDDPFLLPDKTLLYVSNASGKFRILQSIWSRGYQKGKPISSLGNKEADVRSPFYRDDKLYFASNEIPDEKLKEFRNFDIRIITAGREPLPLLGISEKQDELNPWITRDGREFYFSRRTDEGWLLFVARGPVPGPIGDPRPVGFAPGFHHATISSTGLVMYLQGPLEESRAGLYRSKRTKVKGKWSRPEPLSGLSHPKGKRGDMSPCLSPDGKKLYFSSDRPGGKGGLDIWSVDTAGLTR